MRVKIFLIVTIFSACLVGCSNVSVLKNQDEELQRISLRLNHQ